MEILSGGKLEAKCKKCKTHFSFATDDAFARFEVCGVVNSGQFDRECCIYVRCPCCKHRVNITGKVPYEAVKNNKDPLCKCEGNYCNCWRNE